MKHSPSALSTAGLAMFATLGALLPCTAVARSTAPTWVQGAAFSTGSRVSTVTVTLTRPVAQGDLLVGWFSQYDAPEQVRVSDNVNGTWTRAPGSLTPLGDTGDIAPYYRDNSQAAPRGTTITVSAPPTDAPSSPTGLEATSVASTRVAVSWSPSSGDLAGYTVYRDGSAIGTTRPDTTIFVDENVAPVTTYTYAVDAFDGGNDHSAPSAPLTITTAAESPEFIQGAAASTGARLPSYTLRLSESVLAGDLLVGWVGQFGASGEVHVSDNVNGPWTRSVSTTWSGTGDIALFYRENSAPAPSGLVVTVRASA